MSGAGAAAQLGSESAAVQHVAVFVPKAPGKMHLVIVKPFYCSCSMEPCEYRCWQWLSPSFCWPWIGHDVGELEDLFSSWLVCAGEAHSEAVQARQWLQPGHNWAAVERLSVCISGGSTAVSQGR